jgi:hypothetical protein
VSCVLSNAPKSAEQHLANFCLLLLAEIANLVDSGGQFLDSRHDPPLLPQGRKGDLESEETILLKSNAVCCAFTGALAQLHETGSSTHPTQKAEV